MSKSNNTKKWIVGGAIAAGVAAVGLGLYYLVKGTTAEVSAEKEENKEALEKPVLDKEKLFKERILKELDAIPKKEENGHYSVEVIKAINKGLQEFSVPELRKLLQSERKERRATLNDADKYLELYYKLERDYFDLLEKNKEEVLKHLNISLEKWQSDIRYHGENDPEFFIYVSHFPVEVRKQIINRSVSKEELLKILKEQVQILQSEKEFVTKVKGKLTEKNQNDLLLIMQEWADDAVFLKYGIEAEDWKATADKYGKDSDIKALTSRISDGFLELIIGTI